MTVAMILDSNIIIYSAEPQYPKLRELIAKHAPAVSAISFLEVMGFSRITPSEILHFSEFFTRATVFEIDKPVLTRAVALRQQHKMSLGDAIIAATALVHDKTLVTRNVTDFNWIAGLKILDPFKASP